MLKGFLTLIGSQAVQLNKMKKVFDALEAVEGDADQINAKDQLPDDGTEFVKAVKKTAAEKTLRIQQHRIKERSGSCN